jgi:predicted dienelactone hydrolase
VVRSNEVRMLKVSRILCLVGALVVLAAAGARAEARGVGFRTLEVRDPVSGSAMPAVVFYPSKAASGVTVVGPYRLHATQALPIVDASVPLIAFSHGTGGSIYDDHDLATGLAARGFVVAVVQHAGDNYRDRSGLGTDRVLIGRELQMSALIDTVLANATFRSVVDTRRIGAMGFSAGGYDTLLLAGAKPNFALKDGYCRAHAGDQTFCGWDVRVSEPALRAERDGRVRAILAISPVGLYFDREGLSGVGVPVDIWTGGDDALLPLDWNAARIRRLLPTPPRFTQVPKAGHFTFVSPCAPELARALPSLCTDPPAVDRTAIHARLVADAAAFFRVTLGERVGARLR